MNGVHTRPTAADSMMVLQILDRPDLLATVKTDEGNPDIWRSAMN